MTENETRIRGVPRIEEVIPVLDSVAFGTVRFSLWLVLLPAVIRGINWNLLWGGFIMPGMRSLVEIHDSSSTIRSYFSCFVEI
jgi:hypothetical protein